jgi:hypothetical protein
MRPLREVPKPVDNFLDWPNSFDCRAPSAALDLRNRPKIYFLKKWVQCPPSNPQGRQYPRKEDYEERPHGNRASPFLYPRSPGGRATEGNKCVRSVECDRQPVESLSLLGWRASLLFRLWKRKAPGEISTFTMGASMAA